MNPRSVLLGGLVAAGLALASASATQPRAAALAEPETYDIDSGHSSVVFKVKHLDVAWFYGRFNELRGSFVLDAGDPSKSSVSLEIPTASIDTNSSDRDVEMRSPGFFAAEEHPTITFESTKVDVVSEGHWKLTGDLTCKGKTKEVVVELHATGTTDNPRFGHRTGFEGTFELDRTAFDVAAGMSESMLGKTVKVMIGIEGIRR